MGLRSRIAVLHIRPCRWPARIFFERGGPMGLDVDVRRDFLMAFATPILQTRVSEAAEINRA